MSIWAFTPSRTLSQLRIVSMERSGLVCPSGGSEFQKWRFADVEWDFLGSDNGTGTHSCDEVEERPVRYRYMIPNSPSSPLYQYSTVQGASFMQWNRCALLAPWLIYSLSASVMHCTRIRGPSCICDTLVWISNSLLKSWKARRVWRLHAFFMFLNALDSTVVHWNSANLEVSLVKGVVIVVVLSPT